MYHVALFLSIGIPTLVKVLSSSWYYALLLSNSYAPNDMSFYYTCRANGTCTELPLLLLLHGTKQPFEPTSCEYVFLLPILPRFHCSASAACDFQLHCPSTLS